MLVLPPSNCYVFAHMRRLFCGKIYIRVTYLVFNVCPFKPIKRKEIAFFFRTFAERSITKSGTQNHLIWTCVKIFFLFAHYLEFASKLILGPHPVAWTAVKACSASLTTWGPGCGLWAKINPRKYYLTVQDSLVSCLDMSNWKPLNVGYSLIILVFHNRSCGGVQKG